MKEQNKINLWYFLKNYKFLIFIMALNFLIAAISGVGSIITLANSINYVTEGEFSIALKMLAFSLIITILRRLLWYINNIIYYKASNKICADMALELTKRCFKFSSSTFSENNSGKLLQRILSDPYNILSNLYDVMDCFEVLISGIITILYIISLNWIVGILYIVLIMLAMVLQICQNKSWRKNSTKKRKIEDETYSLVGEIIKSERDIKALNMEEKLYESAKKELIKRSNQNKKTEITDCNLWSARNTIIDIGSILILVFGIILLEKSLLTLAVYILFFSYRDSSWNLIYSFGLTFRALNDISVSKNRLFSLYDEKLYPIDSYGTETIKNFKGKIEFKNVGFSYEDIEEIEEDKKKKQKFEIKRTKKDCIFKDLSFTIKPKTTVAFVGKSGSGKSTILSLITKLITADSGKVLIDGIDVNCLDKQTLRDNIALINQFPYIFDMSIRDNLLMSKKDASDEEIWAVLEKACFDQDVKSMPKGLDTKVGETGVKLSGGQRQRLAIARALLKDAKVILFDESTSSLDNFAQKHIQNSIENLKGDHTIIIVAHRLSTIKNVDSMFYIENGKILDSGTFNELFQNNKQFQDMFTIENI